MPFNYSLEEKVDMILIYGEAHQNAVVAERLYAERFPLRNHPQKKIFKRLVEGLKETGSLKPKTKNVVNKPITNELNKAIVLNYADNNNHIGIRGISSETGISKSSVGRILQQHKYHPYHLELHQELHGDDFENRVAFCEWAQGRLREDRMFFKNVLFTDESSFKSNGHVNRHNMHYWSPVNPHWMLEQKIQNRWSLNVWGGIINNRLIGPFFFHQNLTGEIYANFLENELDDLLENVPLNQIANMWFQQDGAPPHFALVARPVVDEKYPNRWIGRGGPVTWPPRSPDLTPMDFFTWGRVKDIVYRTTPTTPEDMRQRIIQAFRSINESNQAATVQDSFEERLEACLEQAGHHFEHLL
jgi:hypothetical protein